MKYFHIITSKLFMFITFVFLPVSVFAQKTKTKGGKYFGEVDSFFLRIMGFINDVLIPLIFALSLLFFLYGMFRYFIAGGGSDDNRATGQKLMWWGIIGFVLMVSIWGIVNVISGGLFGTTAPPKLPGTPTL